MKKLILITGIIIMIISVQVVFGQEQEGAITYETKINLHRTLPADRQDAKAMIPEYRTSHAQLFFNATESLFKPIIEDEEDEPDGNGGGARFRFRQPNVEIYANSETKLTLAKQEFMGKNYLISDSIKVSPWKIGTETKVIMGYTCMQAYYTDTTRNHPVYTAWFTSQIRSGLGPDRTLSLPGTVLALDVNNGERVTVATKVELRPLKKNELKAPSTGTPIDRTAFREMMEEDRKKRNGRDGTVIIRN